MVHDSPNLSYCNLQNNEGVCEPRSRCVETNADDAKAKSGFIDFSHPEIKLPIEDGDFYLCGPVPFMRFCKHALMDLGVKSEQIYYEVFGPHNDL